MGFLSTVQKLCLISLSLPLMFASASAQNRAIIVEIDGDMWRMERHAEHCIERIEAAIEFYKEEPIYNANRAAIGDRFLVNESDECWIELSIQGVDDISFIYKVSQEQVVVDQRGLSWWGYKVFPYPTVPYGD